MAESIWDGGSSIWDGGLSAWDGGIASGFGGVGRRLHPRVIYIPPEVEDEYEDDMEDESIETITKAQIKRNIAIKIKDADQSRMLQEKLNKIAPNSQIKLDDFARMLKKLKAK